MTRRSRSSILLISTLTLSASTLSASAQCPSDCLAPPPGMVAWWMLDEPVPNVAADSALSNQGLHAFGPSIGPGAIGNALDFDGVDDHVVVPDHPSLDFGPASGPGQGDFTIDAWINVDQIRAAHDPIVEKRDQGRGYYFYVWDSFLGLAMSDGSGLLDSCCAGPIPIGVDTHVAVTVDRDSPSGITFYVNGLPIGNADPTSKAGDLSNAQELFLGRNRYSALPGSPDSRFDGMIDDVEIFSRALSAAEIQGIYASCKCRHKCRVPRFTRICEEAGAVTVNVMVCNHGGTARQFNVAIQDTDDCPLGVDCTGPAPTAADITILTPLPILVPAGGCAPVAVQILRPAGLNFAGAIACYEAIVTALDNGQESRCCGSIVDRRDWCPTATSGGGFTPIRPGDPATDLTIQIHNNTGDFNPLQCAFIVEPVGGGGPALSLDGLPPGEPVVRTVKLPPEAFGPVGVEVELVDLEPFASYDVVLFADFDGDGVYEEPMVSATFQPEPSVPCPADLDGDGGIGFGDLVVVLTSWGDCAGCAADLDGDGIVGFTDLVTVLTTWGAC